MFPDYDGDTLHEECGIFGVYAPGTDVARMTFFGLYALAASRAGKRRYRCRARR